MTLTMTDGGRFTDLELGMLLGVLDRCRDDPETPSYEKLCDKVRVVISARFAANRG